MKPTNWIVFGLLWGLMMFLAMDIGWPLVMGNEVSTKNIIGRFLLWIGTGLLFGVLMKAVSRRH